MTIEDTHNGLLPVSRLIVVLSCIEIERSLTTTVTCLRIDMVCLVSDKDNWLLRKIIYGHTILAWIVERRVQALNGSEAEVDTIGISTLEILHFVYLDLLTVNLDLLRKKILVRSGIKKVITRLLNDIGTINEEQEIAVALFV